MPIYQPIYPTSLGELEFVCDPLAEHHGMIVEAQQCPCWECSQRPVCGSTCGAFDRYVWKGK